MKPLPGLLTAPRFYRIAAFRNLFAAVVAALGGLLWLASPSALSAQSAGAPPAENPFAPRAGAVLFDFNTSYNGLSGSTPRGPLVRDKAGNLYGVTSAGGQQSCTVTYGGCGTVFELSPADFLTANSPGGWSYKLLYAFKSFADGATPLGGLTLDAAGNLYGATEFGGTSPCGYFNGGLGCGTLFELSPKADGTWKKTTIYNFTGGADGGSPTGAMVVDSQGNLYGSDNYPGTSNCGVVFQLKPGASGWSFQTLYTASCATPHGAPVDDILYGLILDQAGNLYGNSDTNGYQTIAKLSPSGKTWAKTNLFTFKNTAVLSPNIPLLRDDAGNFYGASRGEGDTTCVGVAANPGCGTVFEVTSNGVFSVLHVFEGSPDGNAPDGSLALNNGVLYGTTDAGGDSTCETAPQPTGCGAAFALRKNTDGQWDEAVIYSFPAGDGADAGSDSVSLADGVISDAAGNLYEAVWGGSLENTILEISGLSGAGASPAAPVLSLPSGVYSSPQTLTITDATPGANIYYSLGSNSAYFPYTGPISVAYTETITAAAALPNAPIAYTSASYAFAAGSPTGELNFSGGFAGAQGALQLNGSAALDGARLRLTNGGISQAGSAFTATPVNIDSFTSYFTFQLTNAAADGITFAIQSTGAGALGAYGANLGYGGIGKSVAIKFDLHNNAGEGNNSTGIYVNGAPPTVPATDLSIRGLNLHSGDAMLAQVAYYPGALILQLTDLVTYARWSGEFNINIPATVGGDTAYVGFTGGTGSTTAVQDILSWTYLPGQYIDPPKAGGTIYPNPTGFQYGFNPVGQRWLGLFEQISMVLRWRVCLG
jgi:uncharacterized repeat protein (TIGR03803 family)